MFAFFISLNQRKAFFSKYIRIFICTFQNSSKCSFSNYSVNYWIKKYHKSSAIVDKMLRIVGFTIMTCYLMRLVFQILGLYPGDSGFFEILWFFARYEAFSDLENFDQRFSGDFYSLGFTSEDFCPGNSGFVEQGSF